MKRPTSVSAVHGAEKKIGVPPASVLESSAGAMLRSPGMHPRAESSHVAREKSRDHRLSSPVARRERSSIGGHKPIGKPRAGLVRLKQAQFRSAHGVFSGEKTTVAACSKGLFR